MEIKPDVANTWAALRPALETMAKSNLPFEDVQEMLLKAYIDVAIAQNGGNISKAGRMIHVHRNTIYRWVDLKWTRHKHPHKRTDSNIPA